MVPIYHLVNVLRAHDLLGGNTVICGWAELSVYIYGAVVHEDYLVWDLTLCNLVISFCADSKEQRFYKLIFTPAH